MSSITIFFMDEAAANTLFERYHSKAVTVVNTYCNFTNPTVSYLQQDILSEALIGLWQACLRFEETTENGFWTFASLRVYGAMIDFLRREKVQVRGDGRGGKQVNLVPVEAEQDDCDNIENRDFVLIGKLIPIPDTRASTEMSYLETRLSFYSVLDGASFSEVDRAILTDFYFLGNTRQEIVKNRSVSTPRVRTAIKDGTQILKESVSW